MLLNLTHLNHPFSFKTHKGRHVEFLVYKEQWTYGPTICLSLGVPISIPPLPLFKDLITVTCPELGTPRHIVHVESYVLCLDRNLKFQALNHRQFGTFHLWFMHLLGQELPLVMRAIPVKTYRRGEG